MTLLEAARQALPGVAWDPQTTYNGATWLTGVGSVDSYNVFDLGDIAWIGAKLRAERDALDADLGETPRSTLTEELAALRESARWIPVGERLPMDLLPRIVVDETGYVFPSRVALPYGAGKWLDFDGESVTTRITHWMDLPTPPEPQAVQEVSP